MRQLQLRKELIGALLLAMWLVPSAGIHPSATVFTWLACLICVSVALLMSKNAEASLGEGQILFWMKSWLIAAVASSIVAILQYFTNDVSAFIYADSPAREAYAYLRQRNQFASLTAMGWLSLLVLSQCSPSQHARSLTIAAGILAMTLALANALTGSRTGALQWVAIAFLMYLWRARFRRETQALALFGSLVYLVFVILSPWIASAVNHPAVGFLSRLNDPGTFSRFALWSNVLELIAQKPWLGWGWRGLAYAHYSTEFSGVRFMEMLDNAHNLPLHLAVELGLPVALAFCGLVGWLVWRNKPWQETRADRQLAWGILLVIGIHSLVEYPLWYGPFFMTALICIGILSADTWRNWLFTLAKYAQRAINIGIKAFALLLLIGTSFAAFDYHRVSQIYHQPEARSRWYVDDPLGAAKKSVLFQSHAMFAELVITPLSGESAPRVLALSDALVMWSPEPRVIEKLIESATMMRRDDLAMFHLKRYKTAYPQAYAMWAKPGQ